MDMDIWRYYLKIINTLHYFVMCKVYVGVLIHKHCLVNTLCTLAPYSVIFSAFRDTPRKRSGALSGSSGSGRSAATVCSLNAEPQPEETVDENFPVSRSVCLLNIETF